MDKYVTLIGTEEVSRAASSMREAGSTMQSASNSMEHALMMHQRFMDDWLHRFELAIDRLGADGSGGGCNGDTEENNRGEK